MTKKTSETLDLIRFMQREHRKVFRRMGDFLLHFSFCDRKRLEFHRDEDGRPVFDCPKCGWHFEDQRSPEEVLAS